MRKIISVLCIVVTMFALTACSKFTCVLCEQEKTGKKHTVEEEGISVTMCDSCYKEYQQAKEELGY